MAETMGGYNKDDLLKQAQNIWTMLDDMAANNPQGYKQFMDKQMKEGKQALAPPNPHMVVKTTMLKPEKDELYINFCSWAKVPGPKTPDDAVPVIGVPIEQMEDRIDRYRMTSVSFNPQVLDKYGRDSSNLTDRDTLINLAMDYIEDQQKVKVSRRYTILDRDTPHKGCLKHIQKSFTSKNKDDKEFESNLENLEKSFGPLGHGGKDKLMEALANISVGDSQSNSSIPKSDQSQIKMPFEEKTATRSNLIEEIASDVVFLRKPEYSMETVDVDSGKCVQVKISLPEVTSVQECELEISQDDVTLLVPDRFELHLQLPHPVDEERATAKFNKKHSSLNITMPWSQ
ncbi:PIH1 domain-containing protein 2-like isoform X1 [Haliotis rufescens]|uniref:PIH1 domain-containing protein 2-like isoform X1 n=1 Tax=Haliotis rufescens TaxID=6454 RepID=UPI00201E88DF|nr:PIH1 domain-containing protein 2-like isoform X1 [Haliotis rufescens]